jgi:hypothetical protein
MAQSHEYPSLPLCVSIRDSDDGMEPILFLVRCNGEIVNMWNIKSKLNSENVCWNSIQNILSFYLQMQINIYCHKQLYGSL